ncbi:hypothetical protein [Microbacterium sp. APC 3901]|uniref:hypothetical protein n=1 Tax=Microbacterium sp. APC 3901 TaxID=3035192 RepID=UPI0025B5EE6F|nr:hypothetical protein [Microbacterium sp. APC 3901]MDN3444143.1 hypothetical protein [Microbacterium sp. APC 3901]
MFVFGISAAVAGIVIFHIALGMTLCANATTRVPLGRGAQITPGRSIALRAVGAGLIVLGGALVSTAGWHWTIMVVLAGPVAALVALTLHNRHVSRGSSST